MQVNTRYLDRRIYIELLLVLTVAVVAVSFGRWVIPSGAETVASVRNPPIAVPAASASRFADLKQAQLEAEDRSAGFGNSAASAGSFEVAHAERISIQNQARLD